MSNTESRNSNHETRSSTDRDHEKRISTIYLVTLYSSVFATLIGLYFAATMLGGLSTMGALSVVGLVGVLALGTMLSATLRSLRESRRAVEESRGNFMASRRLLWRTLPAAGLSLLSGGMAISGHFVVASLCAFLAVAVIRYVPWKASN